MQIFMQKLADILAHARWLEVDEGDIKAICTELDKAESMYLRSLAQKMRNYDNVVLATIRNEED